MRYIAFLRAINVGGHTVPMERLRRLFEELRFSGVESFIASGNLIFEARSAGGPALEARIEAHLARTLGYPVATFLRTPEELAAVVSREPFPPESIGEGRHALAVGFLRQPPPRGSQRALLEARNDVDDLAVHGREVYWLRRLHRGDSRLAGAFIERTLGPLTMRNITTVRKLAAKYPA